MRYLVLSDIHGGATETAQALTFFERYQCDGIVLLGDLLNHGPRNVVPESYTPPQVAALLNQYSTKIISVRGNCDSEVDGMMFNFPCNAPYGYLHIVTPSQKIQKIFLTHGHLHPVVKGSSAEQGEANKEKLGLKAGDIVLSGHTHVSGVFKLENGLININPGSTTIPKGNTAAGLGLILEDRIELRTLDDQLVATYEFAEGLS